MRDTQRSQVYRAESGQPEGSRWKTVDECQAFVDEVLANRRVVSRWGRHNIVVHDGRGARVAYARWDGIHLPKWARTEATILHEIAHLLCREGAPHGWQWAGTNLALIEIIRGDEAADTIRKAYRHWKVRYTKPPKFNMTPEQKEKARASLAKAAAAREANRRPCYVVIRGRYVAKKKTTAFGTEHYLTNIPNTEDDGFGRNVGGQIWQFPTDALRTVRKSYPQDVLTLVDAETGATISTHPPEEVQT